MRKSVTVCKISFLPGAFKLSPGVFNNSVLAVSGDTTGKAVCSRSWGHLVIQAVWVGEEEDMLRLDSYFYNKMVTICTAFIFSCALLLLLFYLTHSLPKFSWWIWLTGLLSQKGKISQHPVHFMFHSLLQALTSTTWILLLVMPAS